MISITGYSKVSVIKSVAHEDGRSVYGGENVLASGDNDY